MTETKTTRIVRRGRLFPQYQWSAEKIAQWKAERAALYQRCQVIFERVKPELIETHYNWFMAIEPESGDYFIDQDEEVATEMARQKYPGAIPVLFKINQTGVCGTL
ncbi:MAG TPA: hypothetical protein DCL61_20115 [Cyanobacteria bacterium UBA12227]|nr:hypothetical protein [Cyanobacteria bacterium UBA12227]HAX86189.1 hypothetical protein [Cyanobacteria bacterium UBA11370]HBY80693.1 hypothetical protein [Cyanobacteria bacterium UBA11148]